MYNRINDCFIINNEGRKNVLVNYVDNFGMKYLGIVLYLFIE